MRDAPPAIVRAPIAWIHLVATCAAPVTLFQADYTRCKRTEDFSAVGGDGMPHLHSEASRAARRLRAIERGYLQSPPAEHSHVAVPAKLADRVRTMAKSMALHWEHQGKCAKPFHYARHATVAAAKIDASIRVSEALEIHRRANRAKHHISWADLSEKDEKLSSNELVQEVPFGANLREDLAASAPTTGKKELSPPRAAVPGYTDTSTQTTRETSAGVVDSATNETADLARAWSALAEAQLNTINMLNCALWRNCQFVPSRCCQHSDSAAQPASVLPTPVHVPTCESLASMDGDGLNGNNAKQAPFADTVDTVRPHFEVAQKEANIRKTAEEPQVHGSNDEDAGAVMEPGLSVLVQPQDANTVLELIQTAIRERVCTTVDDLAPRFSSIEEKLEEKLARLHDRLSVVENRRAKDGPGEDEHKGQAVKPLEPVLVGSTHFDAPGRGAGYETEGTLGQLLSDDMLGRSFYATCNTFLDASGCIIGIGDTVRIFGLKSSPALNGVTGTVVSFNSKERCGIQIPGKTQAVSVRFTNVRVTDNAPREEDKSSECSGFDGVLWSDLEDSETETGPDRDICAPTENRKPVKCLVSRSRAVTAASR